MKRFKAMTLVELVVYLALFGIIFMAIMQFVISTNQNNDTARGRNLIEKNTIYLLRHLEISFSDVISIDESNSVFDSNQGKLVLNTNSGVVEYAIEDGEMKYSEAGSDYDLVPEGFIITNFNLVKILSNDDALLGVIINIDMEAVNFLNVEKSISTSFLIY